ncbi:MAG: hypothetical protein GDA43_09420 [Hormoscilla sp. SP5CHS1]|nr:hypothetical protein [Hormoscilla sp. SP12CHS1]MBC6453403.1 hypothetical protein [Hormoscilla sp. SP5CHS1]
MNNPVVYAFLVGRALAEALGEQLQYTLTDAASALGKFDAEQRERWRNFAEQVMARADQAQAATTVRSAVAPNGTQPSDLQEIIDKLRAETAQLRAELQRYRSR